MSDENPAVHPAVQPTKLEILTAAAKARLAEGYAILPLHPETKQPFACHETTTSRVWHNGVHSVLSASFGPPRKYVHEKTGKTLWTTPAMKAWEDGHECNHAVALQLSDLTVIDIDAGIDSEAELKEFLADFHISETRCIRSGRTSSFGVHLYYQGWMQSSPEPLEISWHGKTIKVAGEGSFHASGQQYIRIWHGSLEPTPVSLFTEMIETWCPSKQTSPSPSPSFDGDSVTDEQFEAWLDKNHENVEHAGFNKQKNADEYIRVDGCPWKGLHTSPDGPKDFAIYRGDGPLAIKCVHESCKAGWTESSGWKSYKAWLTKKNGVIPMQESGTVFVGKKAPTSFTAPTSLKSKFSHPLYTVATVPSVSGGSQEADAMPAPTPAPTPKTRYCMTAEEWEKRDFSKEESESLIGTETNAIIRPLTKNLVVAGDKSFKTTFLMRLGASLASGETVFEELPVRRSCRVLHIHAELNPAEIKQRVIASIANLDTKGQFFPVRDTLVHLIDEEGQNTIREIVEEVKPEVVILDPWQELITGFNENSDEHMGVARKFITQLIDDYKVTAFIVQHTGRDEAKGGRGHSGLKGWRDTQIVLKRKNEQVDVRIEPRWGSTFNFTLAFKDGTLHPVSIMFTKQQMELRELLKGYPQGASYAQIATAMEMSQKSVEKMVNRAVENVPAAVVKQDGLVFHPDTVPDMDDETLEGAQ